MENIGFTDSGSWYEKTAGGWLTLGVKQALALRTEVV